MSGWLIGLIEGLSFDKFKAHTLHKFGFVKESDREQAIINAYEKYRELHDTKLVKPSIKKNRRRSGKGTKPVIDGDSNIADIHD